jgi:2-keto-3-deoxy-L-rhamnonate aldolase RhmA
MQIESQAAVERIDELLSVQGVDAALIGPNDLTLSLGAPDMQDASVNAAIQTVVDSANRHHVASGIHLRSIAQVKTWKDRGMTLLTCSTEMDFIRSGARSVVEALRG